MVGISELYNTCNFIARKKYNDATYNYSLWVAKVSNTYLLNCPSYGILMTELMTCHESLMEWNDSIIWMDQYV